MVSYLYHLLLIETFTSEQGINGKVKSIPANFTFDTVIHLGSGINNTVYTWGQDLLDLGGKKRPSYDSDLIIEV